MISILQPLNPPFNEETNTQSLTDHYFASFICTNILQCIKRTRRQSLHKQDQPLL